MTMELCHGIFDDLITGTSSSQFTDECLELIVESVIGALSIDHFWLGDPFMKDVMLFLEPSQVGTST